MERKHFSLAITLGVAVVAVWLVYLAIVLLVKVNGGMEARGQFGDMFGALNALFAGLAFAGIILTIFLQMKELALQREELKLTREELKRAATANEAAANALAKQIENQLLAARISGLSALLAAASSRIEATPRGVTGRNESIDLRNQLEDELKKLLETVKKP